MPILRKLLLVAAVAVTPGAAAAAGLSAEELAALRLRVQTAANLAMIAETEKDGEMMVMAAKLMSSAGKVARPGKTAADGKPEFFDVKALLNSASGLGADTAKAETMAMSKPIPAMDYCAIGYWRETCDYNNYCRWEYVC